MPQLGNIDLPSTTEYAKEMAKWEAVHTKYGAPGRPYEYRPYPQAMYRCYRNEQGQRVFEHEIAKDDREQALLEGRGFVAGGKALAVEACDRQEHLINGTAAAEREYAIQHGKHSATAVAEVRQAEATAGMAHLSDVPAPKKPGRRKRIATA